MVIVKGNHQLVHCMERGELTLLLIWNKILEAIEESLVVAIVENVITPVQLYCILYKIYIVGYNLISGFYLEIVEEQPQTNFV